MQTQFKDVAHLYLGCEIMDLYNNKIGTFWGVDINKSGMDNIKVLHKVVWDLKYSDVKPILRLLPSMTEEERSIYKKIGEGDCFDIASAKRTNYLLKKGFDLFGLIESGQAIDKTTLNTP